MKVFVIALVSLAVTVDRPGKVAAADAVRAQADTWAEARKTYARLKKLQLPEVEFRQVSFGEGVAWFKKQGIPLEVQKRRWYFSGGAWQPLSMGEDAPVDGDGKSMPTHVGIRPELETRLVDLSLRNVSALEALKQFAKATGTSLWYDAERVEIYSPFPGCGTIVEWKLAAGFFGKDAPLKDGPSKDMKDCREFFAKHGAALDDGGEFAIYMPEKEILLMKRHEQEGIDKVLEMIMEFEP